MPVEIGSGRLIPGFEDQLVGAKAGEERTITVTFPEDYPVETLKGQPAQFAITVKAVQVAATTFRANPAMDTATVISELGVGEALVSTLDRKGVPSVVQLVLVAPPRSRIGPLTDGERAEVIAQSPVKGDYEEASDRESAYELLEERANAAKRAAESANQTAEAESGGSIFGTIFGGSSEAKPKSGGRSRQTVGEAMAKSVARSVGSSIGSGIGRQIVRGILGSLLGGKR